MTGANRAEYAKLLTEFHTRGARRLQAEAFTKGFEKVVPQAQLRYLAPAELNVLICGTAFIDVRDMRRCTVYRGGYNQESPQVRKGNREV